MKNGLAAAALIVLVGSLACRKDRTPPTPAEEPVVEVPVKRSLDKAEADDAGTQEQPTEPSPAEACVDRWLAERKLDRYGHAEGTMYTGGTPLFDERTGESTPRLVYVFRKHPEAHQACAPDMTLPERLPEK